MAEKIISPGVFTDEIDQTFLPAAVADIGAALVGPTLKGPAGIPTVVTSYSDFQAKFGDVVKSGSDSFQYLTSHAAEQYLQNSDTLTVVRVMDGTYAPATASVSISGSSTGATFASASFQFAINPTGQMSASGADEFRIADVSFVFVSSSAGLENSSTQRFVSFGAPAFEANLLNHATASAVANLRDAINAATVAGVLNVSASRGGTGTNLNGLLKLSGSTAGTGGNLTVTTGSGADNVATTVGFVKSVKDDGTTKLEQTMKIQGGTNASTSGTSFVLKTLADGSIMNNFEPSSGTNNILRSGSIHNIRYEVSNLNHNKGTFTLSIRAGNDNHKRKQNLETFTNVSLDPNTTNYIGKQVGDQRFTVGTDGSTKYLTLTGDYPQKSRFVTVETINKTIDYLDENGKVRVASASGSLPQPGSGSQNGGFGGGLDGFSGFDSLGNQNGTIKTESVNFYENIAEQTQGFKPTDLTTADGGAGYAEALDLLANQDEYDINLLLLPGLVYDNHTTVLNKAIDVCEDRGDCFTIVDPVVYNQNPSNAVTQAEARDSNFAAMYYPWVKVPDSRVAGTQRWVPPSVVLGGIYAFNDRVAHPWFAPAGLNRGGITTAIQAQRKLTQGERDTLYDSNVNPIATFPGQGVTVFGQKTLQKKNSALDRINVRRLLIRVKKFVASSSRFLVFEQNTAATRRRFLSIVNPFLEQVQSQSGLSAFRVVMDETNNTPDTIDRNQLVGQLFLQPTRTAEFIVLDFTIQPTGASFPE
jgi:hypothetical protein